MQCEFTNTGKKRNKFGVSFPVFGHLQAGKVLTDDEFFYPMESGMAGKLDCVLRHAYGVTNFMQLMSVWNPVSGGPEKELKQPGSMTVLRRKPVHFTCGFGRRFSILPLRKKNGSKS